MITETERYVISFFGVDSKYYTNEFVAYLWEESANKEYRNSGIFITARMSIERLVCGQIRGCTLGAGLLLGGGLSNLWERIRHGRVLDYLRFPKAPGPLKKYTYNLADLAIFLGAVLMVLRRRRQ